MAQEIALALHEKITRHDSWYAAGDDAIAWCPGRPAWFAWSKVRDSWLDRGSLPDVLPRLENPCARGNVIRLQALAAQADEVVHAGYPDSDGQLVVDEWLDLAGLRTGALRLWTDCLDRDAIRARNAALMRNDAFAELRGQALTSERSGALQRMVFAQLWGYDVDVAEWVVLE